MRRKYSNKINNKQVYSQKLRINVIFYVFQHFVDNWTHKTEKKLSHMKYSSKSSDFLRFYLYLCHVIDDFACC